MDRLESLSHSKWAFREYIRNQEEADAKLDQMNLWKR
jgi:hypothetical protein